MSARRPSTTPGKTAANLAVDGTVVFLVGLPRRSYRDGAAPTWASTDRIRCSEPLPTMRSSQPVHAGKPSSSSTRFRATAKVAQGVDHGAVQVDDGGFRGNLVHRGRSREELETASPRIAHSCCSSAKKRSAPPLQRPSALALGPALVALHLGCPGSAGAASAAVAGLATLAAGLARFLGIEFVRGAPLMAACPPLRPASRASSESNSCAVPRSWAACPPLLPAWRASSEVNSWAVPFSCAALPPSLAISRWRCRVHRRETAVGRAAALFRLAALLAALVPLIRCHADLLNELPLGNRPRAGHRGPFGSVLSEREVSSSVKRL